MGRQCRLDREPDNAFADFWRRVAQHLAGASNVLFGLMNEPHEQSGQQWANSAEAAILTIRSVGAKQEILVPNTYWDSGMHWDSSEIPRLSLQQLRTR